MCSEEEMFDLILNTAREDKRIRDVILNGSRTNPNAIKDIFRLKNISLWMCNRYLEICFHYV